MTTEYLLTHVSQVKKHKNAGWVVIATDESIAKSVLMKREVDSS